MYAKKNIFYLKEIIQVQKLRQIIKISQNNTEQNRENKYFQSAKFAKKKKRDATFLRRRLLFEVKLNSSAYTCGSTIEA